MFGPNCEAINSLFQLKVEDLDSSRQNIISYCENGEIKAQAFVPPECIESQNFMPNSSGQYALPLNANSNRQIKDSRDGNSDSNNGTESGSGGTQSIPR